jgi:hypothetical protein
MLASMHSCTMSSLPALRRFVNFESVLPLREYKTNSRKKFHHSLLMIWFKIKMWSYTTHYLKVKAIKFKEETLCNRLYVIEKASTKLREKY